MHIREFPLEGHSDQVPPGIKVMKLDPYPMPLASVSETVFFCFIEYMLIVMHIYTLQLEHIFLN